MKNKFKIFALFMISLVVLYILTNKKTPKSDNNLPSTTSAPPVWLEDMSIAVVVCGNRSEETLVMIKSALLLSERHLHFFIFADEAATPIIENKLQKWQSVRHGFSYSLLPVQFPSGEYQSEWRKLFKPCASQRLFLPGLLADTDAVLYVDTDTLFLGPVDQVWDHFLKMNASQLAALAPEHEDPHIGWYNRFAKHPFYKPLGVNTGVMLMNLTRMRQFGWEDYITPIYKQYKSNIPWGDQDIINIIFSFHPEKLYVYGCKYNYRADHCMYSSVCKQAETEGIVVLHGSRGIFHNNKHPTFRSVYKAVEDYDWSSDLSEGLLKPLKTYLQASPKSQCGFVRHAFHLNLENYIQKIMGR